MTTAVITPLGSADLVVDQSVGAVRNPNSATDAYDAVVRVARATVISAQPTAYPIGGSAAAADVRLVAINIVKALTGTVTITGFKDQAGVAASIVIPAGGVGLYDFGGILNDAGQLTVALNNAADVNNVIVRHWPA